MDITSLFAGIGIFFLVLIFGATFFLRSLLNLFKKPSKKIKAKNNLIGVIDLNGPIVAYQGTSTPLKSDKTITTRYVAKAIEYLVKKGVKAIIFRLDSPGGAVVPSKEIGDIIKKLNIPTVALVRNMAASGGYWIASCCDVIVANPFSRVGSIGVIMGLLNYKELAEFLGVKYNAITSGKHKDMGNPFKDLTSEQMEILEKDVKFIHEKFVLEISRNRKLSIEKVQELATGLTFFGETGKELGLVDVLGGQEKAIAWIENELNFKHEDLLEFKNSGGFLKSMNLITHSMGSNFGRGFIESVMSIQDDNSQIKM